MSDFGRLVRAEWTKFRTVPTCCTTANLSTPARPRH